MHFTSKQRILESLSKLYLKENLELMQEGYRKSSSNYLLENYLILSLLCLITWRSSKSTGLMVTQWKCL